MLYTALLVGSLLPFRGSLSENGKISRGKGRNVPLCGEAPPLCRVPLLCRKSRLFPVGAKPGECQGETIGPRKGGPAGGTQENVQEKARRKKETVMKKVIVTGGCGFIGSHTVVELQQKGYTVVIADDLSNSTPSVVENIGRITGEKPILEIVDLSDRTACLRFFKVHSDADAVIHFAAAKAVGESVSKPLHYYRNNIGSLLNVLDAMERSSCRTFVFSSSCTVYGQPDHLPVTEQTPRKPACSPYGNTKQVCEDVLADLVASCRTDKGKGGALSGASWKILSLRYFNPIGAHPSALIGELPNGEPNNLMPYITQTAAGIRPLLKVFGNDYPTPDGTPVRDYIHVCDLAEAHVKAMEYMQENGFEGMDCFNLGTGRGYSVLEVIGSFERVTGIKLAYEIAGRRDGDIAQIWADAGKAERLLGWKARRTLDEMTLSAWKWQENLQKKI